MNQIVKQTASRADDTKKSRVLVVEDDAASRKLIPQQQADQQPHSVLLHTHNRYHNSYSADYNPKVL